jgi:hypothetical protein
MNSQLTSTIGTCGSIGSQGSIGTCGSIGINGYSGIGITGLQGTTGPRGYQITDWKEDMMKKYPRFTITTEYEDSHRKFGMTFAPTNIIIDTHEVRVSKDTNNTRQEYKFKPSNISDIMNETEQFIQRLIITIREDKINTIINGTES